MTAMATMSMMNPTRCSNLNSRTHFNILKVPIKPISIVSLQNLPKGLVISKSETANSLSSIATGSAIAGGFFSYLSFCDSAMAVQQIAEIADGGDNRGFALLLPIIPALLWVLYNILQPALNQLNRMRNTKGILIGLGLGGLAAYGFPESSTAGEIASVADAAAGDNRGSLLLLVITPAILWVLYNILQPALNQLNRMRSD